MRCVIIFLWRYNNWMKALFLCLLLYSLFLCSLLLVCFVYFV